VLKRDRENIFDVVYTPVPKTGETFDDTIMLEAREAFYEAVDALKKEKRIKATLELAIVGDIESFTISDEKDCEDWFVVSEVRKAREGDEVLASFEVLGKHFDVVRASGHKCPRCWRYTA
jgi:isoleucyl-tRNA synthetase